METCHLGPCLGDLPEWKRWRQETASSPTPSLIHNFCCKPTCNFCFKPKSIGHFEQVQCMPPTYYNSSPYVEHLSEERLHLGKVFPWK